jgi:hypothetical protein
MRRRGLLGIIAGLPVAGCTGGSPPAASTPSPWIPASRATPAVAADYTWLTQDSGFSGTGFCLTWLRAVSPGEFAHRMGARVMGSHLWDSLPDPGDGDMAGLGLEDTSRRDYTEAALVLTERLTGVPLTAGLLHGSSLLAATIPDPLR